MGGDISEVECVLDAGRGSGGSEGTELMFSWFRLARSISGVNTMGVPLAEMSLYNTYRAEAQCAPKGQSDTLNKIQITHL